MSIIRSTTTFEIKRQQRAFSLIEVLVALVVLAIGMLGIAQMLLLSHKANASSYIRQQATQSAYNIIDRMRANRLAAIAGNYTVSNLAAEGTPTIPTAPATNCTNTTCTTTQLAAYDTWYWLATDVSQLPNGCGSITTAPSGTNTLITVTVQWNDTPAQIVMGAANPAPTQLTMQTEL